MTTATVSARDQMTALVGELTEEQAAAIANYVTDLVEAAKADTLDGLDRDEFRDSLGLKRFIPEPTLTPLAGVVLPGKDVPLGRRIADGGYDWKNPDITPERFPITLDAGPADLFLAHFGDDIEMESEEVEAWAEANSYEVAYIEEELAVGAHYEHGKLQLQFPIVALGSSAVVDGKARVLYLNGSGVERDLDLGYRDDGWSGGYRFLLRKKPLAPGAIGSG